MEQTENNNVDLYDHAMICSVVEGKHTPLINTTTNLTQIEDDSISIGSDGSDGNLSDISDVESLQDKLITLTVDFEDKSLKNELNQNQIGNSNLTWINDKIKKLRSILMKKLPLEKQNDWKLKGMELLQKHGLIEVGKTIKSDVSSQSKILLSKYPRLNDKIQSITQNKNLLDEMKGKLLNNDKLGDILTKTDQTYDSLANDSNTKSLIEKTKLHANQLLESKEGKELLSKATLLSEKIIDSRIAMKCTEKLSGIITNKAKTINNHETDEKLKLLLENEDKLEALTDNLKKKFDLEEVSNDIANNTSKVLDGLITNKDIITSTGINFLNDLEKKNQGQKLISKGLGYIDQIEQEGGIDNFLEKHKINFDELTTNKEKKDNFINSVKDTLLDFLLQFLPNIAIPKICGEKEGYLYEIGNLSLQDFHIQNKDVTITWDMTNNSIDNSILRLAVKNLKFSMNDVSWMFKKSKMNIINGAGILSCSSDQGRFGFQIILVVDDNTPNMSMLYPYILFDKLDIYIQESKLSWIYNTLISLFETTLKQKIESLLLESFNQKSSTIINILNKLFTKYWPTLLQIMEIDNHTVISNGNKLLKNDQQNHSLVFLRPKFSEYNYTFTEKQLGMMLENTEDMQEIAGSARVIGFSRGTFKKKLQAEQSNLIQIKDIIVKIDNLTVLNYFYEEIIGILVSSTRPITITFRRYPE